MTVVVYVVPESCKSGYIRLYMQLTQIICIILVVGKLLATPVSMTRQADNDE